MTTLRQFRLDDVLKFNQINLDVLTETFNGSFYLAYLAKWPESFVVAEGPHHDDSDNSKSQLMGYALGKAEGEGILWHGHVSALTVAPEYRRLGLAKTLMSYFEDVCINTYNAYFVDLFVRSSNSLAINMYQQFGYSVYRRVLGYYSSGGANADSADDDYDMMTEDALDMRKALPRDKNKLSVIPMDRPVRPEELEW